MNDKVFLSADETKRLVERIHSYPIVDALITVGIIPVGKTSGRPMWMCPFHTGKSPALKMIPGSNVVYCHACKKQYDFIEIIRQQDSLDFIEALLEACRLLNITIDTRPPRWLSYIEKTTGEKLVDKYDYQDIKTGRYAYSKFRLLKKNGEKDFRFGVIDDNDQVDLHKPVGVIGMYGNVAAVKESINAGKSVYMCEGEKDCDTLRKNGFRAVVTYGACVDWKPEMAGLFQGARLIVFRDNDDPGKDVAQRIERDTLQTCRTCIVVNPCPDLPGGDVSDFFAGYVPEKAAEQEEADPEPVPPGDRDGLQKKISSAWYSFMLRFHNTDVNMKGELTVKSVNHDAIFQYLRKKIPYLHTKKRLWVYDDGAYNEMKSEAILLDRIGELMLSGFRKAGIKKAILELFYQDLETSVTGTLEDMNRQPKGYVNFANGMYSLEDGELHERNPSFRCLNRIPWEYEPGRKFSETETDLMDNFLDFISDGQKEKKELVLEFLAYCMTVDTFLQKFVILKGSGGNGKGVLLRLFLAIVGADNISAVPLEKLEDRFSAANVTGKLLNVCGDISSEPLADVRTIKQLTGEDVIFCDRKYGEQYQCKPYAKFIFSANSIPIIQGETADGFYRRLVILEMNRKPERTVTDFEEKLHKQIPYLISLAMEAGRRLYERGALPELEESTVEIEELRAYSDSVVAWLHDGRESGQIKFGNDRKVERKEAHNHYEQYCKDNDRQPKGRNAFFKNLEDKGYRVKKVRGFKYFSGFDCWISGNYAE